MGYKTLELTLISGKDLKNVSLMGGKMDVYVVASISGDPHSKQKTPTHQDGGSNPCWNHTLRFNFDESTATYSAWEVLLLLRHDALGPDKDIGEVRVPIKDLISAYKPNKDNDEPEFVTYQVRSKSSGKGRGELRISYRIKDAPAAQPKETKAPAMPYPPQMASASAYQQPYPPPPQGTAYAYPAPAPGYPAQPAGYPQYGGGYPQQQPVPGGYGYGYPAQGGYPVQQKPQKQKKAGGSGFGMGLGAGLLGGAVGGLLIGEMMEDSFDGDF